MVGSSVESQTATLIASGWLFGRESDGGSGVVGSSEESQTATLILSGRLFGRESDSGSDCEWSALR